MNSLQKKEDSLEEGVVVFVIGGAADRNGYRREKGLSTKKTFCSDKIEQVVNTTVMVVVPKIWEQSLAAIQHNLAMLQQQGCQIINLKKVEQQAINFFSSENKRLTA